MMRNKRKLKAAEDFDEGETSLSSWAGANNLKVLHST